MKQYKNHVATVLVSVFLLPAAPLRADAPVDQSAVAGEPGDSATANDENAAQPANLDSGSEITINRYEARIQQLESEHGVYHPGIAEALLSLGMAYKDLNNHSDATDSFKRGMQISRVNHGLYSLEQLPYLEFLIKENAATENWEELSNNYHYLYWLYKRNYGENDARLLPVIDRVTQSQVAIFHSNPEMFTARNLRDREEMVGEAIEIIETNYGANDVRLINAYNQLALTNYYIALETGYFHQYRNYRNTMHRANLRELTRRVVVPVGMVNGRVIYQTVEIPNTRSGAYLKPEVSEMFNVVQKTEIEGKLALNKIEELHDNNPELSLVSHALALIHKGDWRLLYESGKGAKEYREAHELLNRTGNGPEYINRLFGQPRPIPSFLSETEETLTQPPVTQQEIPGQNYIEVSYDVTPVGRAVNIQIISQPSGLDASVIRHVKRYISNTRFRPRFEDAKPVMTNGVKVKYPVDAQGQLLAGAA